MNEGCLDAPADEEEGGACSPFATGVATANQLTPICTFGLKKSFTACSLHDTVFYPGWGLAQGDPEPGPSCGCKARQECEG